MSLDPNLSSIRNNQFDSNAVELEEGIDLKKWILKILLNWYLFAIALVVAFGVAYFINKQEVASYKVSTTVLIEEFKRSNFTGAQSMMQGYMLGDYTNVNNQVVILQSYNLIHNAVDKLELSVDYSYKEGFRILPFYQNSPIHVKFDSISDISGGLLYQVINIDGQRYVLRSDGNDDVDPFEQEERYGSPVTVSGSKFTIHYNNSTEILPEEEPIYQFNYRSVESLVHEFNSRIKIDYVMDEATIAEVSLTGPNIARDIDFLNTLTQEFLADNLKRKNQEAVRTIDFLDTQLVSISDSLHRAENRLQDFRSQNLVMDISSQARMLIERANALENEKANLKAKNNYYLYIKKYLINRYETGQLIAPTTMGIQDPLLTQLVKEMSELQNQKLQLGAKNPLHSVLKKKIETVRKSLLETTNSIISSSNMSIRDVENRLDEIQHQAEDLPATERQLLGIERKFSVNDSYYTYLLQKRSEAQIQQASNTPDNLVLDRAMLKEQVNSNKKKINFLIALVLGGGIPLLYLILMEYFNNRIQKKEDIEKLTTLPILGMIPHSQKEAKVYTVKFPKSTFAEAFRTIRTRLEFMTGDTDPNSSKGKTIMVTSCVPGEGKTFVSLNLAGIFGLSGKKTALLGFDLRKPKIADVLGYNPSIGISNYLIGKASLDDIIHEHEDVNYDIIASGTIPPNPFELISSPRTKQFMTELKERYDYIIIDTCPVGVVSDAYLLAEYADVTLFVVRHDQSDKNLLKENLTLAQNNKVENIGILVNDVQFNNSAYRYGRYVYGRRYGYGYGYEYGYGYGNYEGYIED